MQDSSSRICSSATNIDHKPDSTCHLLAHIHIQPFAGLAVPSRPLFPSSQSPLSLSNLYPFQIIKHFLFLSLLCFLLYHVLFLFNPPPQHRPYQLGPRVIHFWLQFQLNFHRLPELPHLTSFFLPLPSLLPIHFLPNCDSE